VCPGLQLDASSRSQHQVGHLQGLGSVVDHDFSRGHRDVLAGAAAALAAEHDQRRTGGVQVGRLQRKHAGVGCIRVAHANARGRDVKLTATGEWTCRMTEVVSALQAERIRHDVEATGIERQARQWRAGGNCLLRKVRVGAGFMDLAVAPRHGGTHDLEAGRQHCRRHACGLAAHRAELPSHDERPVDLGGRSPQVERRDSLGGCHEKRTIQRGIASRQHGVSAGGDGAVGTKGDLAAELHGGGGVAGQRLQVAVLWCERLDRRNDRKRPTGGACKNILRASGAGNEFEGQQLAAARQVEHCARLHVDALGRCQQVDSLFRGRVDRRAGVGPGTVADRRAKRHAQALAGNRRDTVRAQLDALRGQEVNAAERGAQDALLNDVGSVDRDGPASRQGCWRSRGTVTAADRHALARRVDRK